VNYCSNEYKATDFTKKGFKVGCQEVTWNMVDQINKIRCEIEKEK